MHIDIEYLTAVQKHTIKSLQQLQNEITEYITSTGCIFQHIVEANERARTFEDNIELLNLYDNFLTCLNTINCTARKYSLQLDVNNLQKNGKSQLSTTSNDQQNAIEKTVEAASYLQFPKPTSTTTNHCENKQFNSVIVNNNFTIHSKKFEVMKDTMSLNGIKTPTAHDNIDCRSAAENTIRNSAHREPACSLDLNAKYDKFFDEVFNNNECQTVKNDKGTNETAIAPIQQDYIQSALPANTNVTKIGNPFLTSSPAMEEINSSNGQIFEHSEINYDMEEMCLRLKQNFTFKSKPLTKYNENSIHEFCVAYIENLEKLQFYVIDPHDNDTLAMAKPPIIGEYDELPAIGDVFIVLLENLSYRAVRTNDQNNSNNVLLLELGETLKLTDDEVFLKIPKKYRNTPAQAIPCTFHAGNDSQDSILKEQLEKLIYNKSRFHIHKRHENYLELILEGTSENLNSDKLVKADNTNEVMSNTLTEQTIELTPNSTEDCRDLEFNVNDLTPSEKAMLYDEPLSTTNPMIAVMGYNPKDDKRLCPFFDPKTGGCFKGSNCTMVHMPREPNGWTKDDALTNCISNNKIPTIIYEKGQVLEITPTYVVDGVSFFAQINDQNTPIKPLIWSDDEIPKSRLLKNKPLKYDLVTARFNDGNWYRGQIRDISPMGQLFKVFFLDYGNEMMVSFCDLARYYETTSLIPPQARFLKIGSARDSTGTKEERQKCIEFISSKILNRNVVVKVLEQVDEDIFVGFMGNHCNLKKQLVSRGFIENTANIFD